MLNWKEIVQKYISKHTNRIRKTTQPLHDHFGIGYFTYHKIDNTGKYTVLVDRPEWAEHYVSEQIYLNDPYLRHPSVYKSGISLIESHGTDEYKEIVLQAGKNVLDMDMGAILIQKNEGSVEFFGFSGNKKNSLLQGLYLNRPQVLKSFANHFKTELKPILTQMEQEAGSLVDLKGKDFFCDELIVPDIDPKMLLAYYRDLGIKVEHSNAKKLSNRERQCLKLLIEEKSAKETAIILNLSTRTVESYFENIKCKLSCWNKSELLKLARQFDELGVL
jgi:DNA-binding CsgD family transcriptional regulator